MDKVEADYHRVTAELDAKEILHYLNDLGIRNISGEVLKHFITDLKKLIKYDLQQKHGNLHENLECQGLERLHSASTLSSRLRSKNQNKENLRCSREDPKCHHIFNARKIHSAPVLFQKPVEEKVMGRSCSCVRVEKKVPPVSAKTTASSGSLIKVAKQEVKKKCDPVSLYHHYMTLWSKYKNHLPGENNWSELRWEMRQKMAGCGDNQNKINKKVAGKQKSKEKKEDDKIAEKQNSKEKKEDDKV